MRRLLTLSLVLLSLAGCGPKTGEAPEATAPSPATSAPRAPSLEDPLPLDPGVTAGQLPNGLRYYIEENGEPHQRAVLQLVLKVGSVMEDPDQLGLAHVVEHMAFNGTRSFAGNDLIKYLESVGLQFGAHLNAHTGFDETVYKLQIPTDDPEQLEKAFVVLSDWAQGITFDPAEVEKERGVVLEEWRRTRGAGGRAKDELLPLTFHGSRYRDREPIGTEESLRTFTHEALQRFYRDWYRPDLMAVVAVGDFESSHMEALIKKYFAPLTSPEPEHKRARDFPAIPKHEETLYGIVADPELPRTSVSVMFKTEAVEGQSHRHYRNFIIENLAVMILNERLGDVAQSAEAPFLGAGVGKQRLTPTEGAYLLGAAAREGEVNRALTALLNEVRRLQLYGFTQAELDRAKAKQMRTIESYHREQRTTDSWTHAAEIIRHFTTGEPMPGIAYEYELAQRFLPEITAEEVSSLAKGMFGERGRVVSVTMPRKEGLAVPTAEELASVVVAAAQAEVAPPAQEAITGNLLDTLPQGGSIVEESSTAELGVTEWRLSNGARVVLKPTQFKSDALSFSAFSWGGRSLASEEDIVAAATATGIAARSGLGDRDLPTLAKLLAGKKVRVMPWIADYQEGLSGGASPHEMELLFQLIHLTMTAPRFDETAFTLQRESLAQGLQNRLVTPAATFEDTYTKLLWQDHPRYRPWTVERLQEMNLDKSRQLFRERFANAADFTFVFVGRFEVDQIKPLVTRYLGSLPGDPAQVEAPLDVGARRASGVHREVVRAGIDPQAAVKLTFHGEMENTREERYRLGTMGDVLEVLLREQLREELGGTYSVSVSTAIQEQPVPRYELQVSFGCDPSRAEELTARTLQVVNQIRSEPVPAEYVQQTQQKQRRGYETSLRQDSFWLGALTRAYQRNEPLEWILRYPELVNALQPDHVLEAAKKYLNLDQYVQVMLLPKESRAQDKPAAGGLRQAAGP